MNEHLPSRQELLSKTVELESYVQTLEQANESKNAELVLLRKKAALLKDQNMVLKVRTKSGFADKHLPVGPTVAELEDKLKSAMQQCTYLQAENQRLASRLQLQSQEGVQYYPKRNSLTLNAMSPTKLSYPIGILRNHDNRDNQSNSKPSYKYNTVEKRPRSRQYTFPHSQKLEGKSAQNPIEDSLQFSKDYETDVLMQNQSEQGQWMNLRSLTTQDNTTCFGHPRLDRRNAKYVGGISSHRDKMWADYQADLGSLGVQDRTPDRMTTKLRTDKRRY